MIKIGNKVYNANEAGNFLWGLVLEFNGSFVPPNSYAEAGSKQQGRHDEPWEQRAIDHGRKLALDLLKDKDIRSAILQRRIEFRTGDR